MDEAVPGQPLKKLFVTGGHGFVGQWVQRLAGEIATGFGFSVAIPSSGFDLLDATQIDEELARHRPDAILHLAGQSNVPLSFKDPEGTLRVNLIGTLRLFEGIKRAGLAPRVVFASSGDVYGKVPEEEMPVCEDRIPHPRNPYAVSKLAAESLCYQWSQTEGLEVMVARPFNHVGAGQSDGFVLPYFARQIAEIRAKRRPARIEVGNIDVSRDFTHVADVVNAYLTLIGEGTPGETYNIASGVDRVVRDLLLRMLELAGVQVAITQDPDRMRHAEQRVVRGANAKIERLGWRPTRSIEMALTEILEEWERKTSNE